MLCSHSIGLPGRQAELVHAALATNKPVVAVILSGGSVSVDSLKTSGSPVAVVYAGFGGETGQNAIIDVLFGDAPASGRLPFTVYPESCEYIAVSGEWPRRVSSSFLFFLPRLVYCACVIVTNIAS